MMTKMHKARINAIGNEINETINEIQKYINIWQCRALVSI